MAFFLNFSMARKLTTVFGLLIALLIAVGGGIRYYQDKAVVAGSNVTRVESVIQKTYEARFFLSRQENSLRGYLLTFDDYYVERLRSHNANMMKAVGEIEKLGAVNPAIRPLAEAMRSGTTAWFTQIVEQALTLAANPATRDQARALVGRDGQADKLISPAEDAMTKMLELEGAVLKRYLTAQDDANAAMGMVMLIAAAVMTLLATGLGFLLWRSIAAPAAAMTTAMRELAGGKNDVVIPGIGRRDEIGGMAAAVAIFRDAAVEKARVEAEAAAMRDMTESERRAHEAQRLARAEEMRVIVTSLASGLERLARGDLTARIDQPFAEEYEKLRQDFNEAMAQLNESLSVVDSNTRGLQSGSGEISHAAEDLSRRTEQQAAALEETAAALDEITVTIKKTADGAREASTAVASAKVDAARSGEIVREAVTAMSRIEQSAKQISQIIGVIDEIAFQTNLLALNAGVEAARAGEAGKGFAVVASEVRALAQRSAEAAKEIKSLISASTEQVFSGVELVGQTGQALERIVGQVAEIDRVVSSIAASAQEQASGIQEVNSAVNQMDQTTQQNAAMVEQSTAASRTLAQQASDLARLVANFKLVEGDQQGLGSGRETRVARSAPAMRTAPARSSGGALRKPAPVTAAETESWEEF